MDLQSAIRSLGPAHSQDTFEDALRFLADPDNRDWLIILDNADDPELPLTMYLPECDHGTIIVTSRNSALAKLASTSHLQLQGMNESDSFQVLFKSAQRERTRDEKESRAAIELGKLLGGLPLALVHVGCYCDTTKITFSEYSERFKSHRSKLMAMQPPLQLDKYSYSTYTSIGLSYSLLDEYSRDFLHLIAFLHPSNIHLDILRIASKSGFDLDWVWNLSPRDDQFSGHMDALRQLLTPNGFWSDVYVDSLLNQLQSFSLISLSKWNGQTNITIHPLVQSCILDTLSPEAYSRHFHMAVLMLSCCCRPGAASLAQQLSTHISELEIRQVDIHLKDAACFAYIFMMSGNFEESMKKWARVRDRCEEVNGKKHRLTLQMSYLVAECLCRMREYEAAESMIRGIAKSQEMIFGELDGDTIDSHRLLANILSDQHKTEEAEKTLKHLLALSEARYGRENRRTLEIQSSLVGNLAAQGEHAEVVTFSRKVLPIMKAVLDEEDEDLTLYTMGIMSRALTQLGGWAEAEAIRSDMIARETIKYGRHHPNTLNSLFSFTFCLAQRAEWDEAEMIIQEVLEARRRLFGMNHHDVIDALAQCNYIAEQRLLHVANNEVSDTFDPPHPVNPVSSYNPEPLYMANNEGPNTFSPPHPGSSSSSHNPKQQWKSKNIWKLLRLK
jgi:tetratricopeptide (TPR) repeat protein